MSASPTPTPKRPPGRPRKIEPEALRERVLDAAIRVFAENGHNEASSDRIAALCGIPRQTIYRMFGSKDGVFTAAVDRALTRIVDHMTEAIAQNRNAHGREITSLNVRAFFELIPKEPHVIRLLQLAETSGSANTESAARGIRRRIESAVAAYLQQTWEGRRPLADREAHLGSRMVVALVEAAAVDYMENRLFSVDELGEFVVDFIRTGFTTLREAEPD